MGPTGGATENQGSSNQASPSLLPNGYILPEGKVIPNTIFVGGISFKVVEAEIRDLFARFSAVKMVKIITNRTGIRKRYGFVYFNEDVNVQTIIQEQLTLRGRKLKLGPAIMKERSARPMQSRPTGPAPWISPNPSICLNSGAVMAQPSVPNGVGPYNQAYSDPGYPRFSVAPMPMDYPQNNYAENTYVQNTYAYQVPVGYVSSC
ncbi:deleted in azoospermia-like [Diretmus argenteus]